MKTKRLKTKRFLTSCLTLLLVLANFPLLSSPAEAQQQETIAIEPTSGPPGTVVTLTIIAGSGWNACYAGKVPLGPVSSIITYTIPPGASGRIEFFCDTGQSAVTSYIRSNIVYFSVIQQLDSDGDGVLDNQDQCPQVPGPAENAGCPILIADSDDDGTPDDQDMCPATFGPPEGQGCPDEDQDGLPTHLDECPTQWGPPENNGCPVAATAVPLPTATVFNMPTSGPCVIATLGDRVNIRQGPSTDTAILGQIQPGVLYNVIGRTLRTDGWWYQIPGGWVAGFVVQTGGYCADLPDTGPPEVVPTVPPAATLVPTLVPPTAPPGDTDGDGLVDNQDACPFEAGPADNYGCPVSPVVELAVPQIDLAMPLAECPDLVPEAQTLPVFVQAYVASISVASPCAYVEGLLLDLVFGAPDEELSEENVNAILEECPEVLPVLTGMMSRLYGINPNAWQILDSVMTPENACELASAIAGGQIPPDFAAALAGTAAVSQPRDALARTSSEYPMSERISAEMMLAPASAALVDTAIAMCIAMPISLERATLLRERIQAAGVQDTDIFVDPCGVVDFFASQGDLSPAQLLLIETLQTECGLMWQPAIYVAVLAHAYGIDIPGVLSLDPAVLCSDISGALLLFQKDPTTDPGVSPNMLACAEMAYHLQSFAAELSLYQLWVILSSPTPCVVADKFVTIGSLDLADQTFPLPACFDTSANTVTLDDSTVLSGASPWDQKIAILSRSPGDICTGMVLPPGDTDLDGVPDDIDLCPDEFALTPNGCPGGAPPNTPPVIDPILDQALDQGAMIDVGVAAADMDGDPLTIVAVSADPAIADVSMAGLMLTITGNAAGVTTITVTADDGTDTTDVMFGVTVNAPAPNTPPTVNPIGDQTVPAGLTVSVAVSAADADGDPLLISAAPANGTIAAVSISGNVLTLTGLIPGATPITVFVGDGSTTASTVFNLTVTLPPAPPATAVPPTVAPPPPPPVSTPGATPSSTLDPVSQAAIDQVTNAGLVNFGLLPLPGEFVLSGSAAFQATAGEGQPVNIFVIVDGAIQQPFEDTDLNRSYPTLSPEGDLLAFLTQDATGNITLRMLNVQYQVSLPILEATSEWTVGLYPPAWSPDGLFLLVTLLDATGQPSIYRIDLTDPTDIPAPEMLVSNASSAVYAPNGRYIAFERESAPGQRSVYVMAETAPDASHIIANLPAGGTCFTPKFGADSLSLFFVCEVSGQRAMYRYDVRGLEQVNLGVNGAANPVPGPGKGFLGFDDGTVIYYGYDDGSNVAPMLRLENQNASHVHWTTIADVDEASPSP